MPDQTTGRPTDEELRQIAEDPWVTYAPDIPRRMAIELRELRARLAGLEAERDEALGRYDIEHAARTGAEYGAHAARETRNRMAAKLRTARARVSELEERGEKHRIRLAAAEDDLLEVRGALSPNGRPRRIPAEVDIRGSVVPAVEWLLARVIELETTAIELLAAHRRVTELEAAHAAAVGMARYNSRALDNARAKRGHIGWVTGHRHADGKWHIAFDGEPWSTLDEANVDVQDASTETPDVDWRALAVYAETGEPYRAQEVAGRG